MIKVRPAPVKFAPRKVVITDDGKGSILVNKKTDAIIEKSRNEAVDPNMPFRTEKSRGYEVKQIPNIIDSVFSERLIYHLLAGWDLQKKHLQSIFNPELVEIEHDGSPEDIVPFSEDIRLLVSKYGDDSFRSFVLQTAVDSQAYFSQATSEEIKN
jgi:hypothetical protein